MKNVITLIIVDGYGYCMPGACNSEIEMLMDKYPHTMLISPGVDNGLSEGDSGSPKTSYLHIGAGREPSRQIPVELENTFGEYISTLGLQQTRIYSSADSIGATYYFSGKNKNPFTGEKRVSVAAEIGASAKEMLFDITSGISKAANKEIKAGKSDVIIISVSICETIRNSDNADFMSEAYAAANSCVDEIINITKENGGIAFVTSTNSCIENSLGENTKNLVPFIVVGADICLKPGRLSDVAPTILDIMGLSKPEEMTGNSLIYTC